MSLYVASLYIEVRLQRSATEQHPDHMCCIAEGEWISSTGLIQFYDI